MSQNPYAPPSVAAEQQAPVPATIGEQQFAVADLGPRILAKLIDTLLLAAAFVPFFVANGIYRYYELLELVLVVPPSLVLIFQWTLISTTGQSLGKRWMGLRIITFKRARVGFFRGVFLRVWVMKLGSAALYGFPLLFDPLFGLMHSGQCLHDHLADTLVIKAGTTGDPYV